MERNTLVVNLLAGSGAGKSTCSARLFAMLKEMGIETELVTEYVKDMVWENRTKIFECQPYIFGKQLYKIQRIVGCVDVIVTDSPFILSALYDEEQDEDFKNYIIKKYNSFNTLNIFLHRVVPFNPNGRRENNIDEAIANDNKLLNFLDDNNIDYYIENGNINGCEEILKIILERLKENEKN